MTEGETLCLFIASVIFAFAIGSEFSNFWGWIALGSGIVITVVMNILVAKLRGNDNG